MTYKIVSLYVILSETRKKDSIHGLVYAVILWVVSSWPVGGTKEPKRSPSKGGKPILEVFWNTEDKEHRENSYTAFDKVVKSYILTCAWATFKLSVRNFIYKAAKYFTSLLLLDISRGLDLHLHPRRHRAANQKRGDSRTTSRCFEQ